MSVQRRGSVPNPGRWAVRGQARPVWLVTGATGRLGAEILARLLRDDPGAKAVALVRAVGEGAGAREASLRERLRVHVPELEGDRVEVVAGDVQAERCGLGSLAWRRLTRRVTHVLHAAGRTALDEDLETARCANVGGTARVLALARACRALERFVHVSTAFVAGERAGLVREDDPPPLCFRNAYERSKREAEALLRHGARDRFPVTVLRPSIVVGDAATGRLSGPSALDRALAPILKGRLAVVPGSGEAFLDIVPVDYVAEAAAHLARCAPEPDGTYHLVAGPGRTLSARRVVAIAWAVAGRRPGAEPMFAVDAPTPASCPAGALYRYLGREALFDGTRTLAALAGTDARVPSPDAFLPRILALRHARNAAAWAGAGAVEPAPLGA